MANKLNLTIDDLVLPLQDGEGKSVPVSSRLDSDLVETLNAQLSEFYTRVADSRIESLSADQRDAFQSGPSYGSIPDADFEETLNAAYVAATADSDVESILLKVLERTHDLNSVLSNMDGKQGVDAMADDLRKRIAANPSIPRDAIEAEAQKVIRVATRINEYAIATLSPSEAEPEPAEPDVDAADTGEAEPETDDDVPLIDVEELDGEQFAKPNGLSGDPNEGPQPDIDIDDGDPDGVYGRLAKIYSTMYADGSPDLSRRVTDSHFSAILAVQDVDLARDMLESKNIENDPDLFKRAMDRSVRGTGLQHTYKITGKMFRPSDIVTDDGQSFALNNTPKESAVLVKELDEKQIYDTRYKAHFRYDDDSYTETDGKTFHLHLTPQAKDSDRLHHSVFMLQQLKAMGNKTITFQGACDPEFVTATILASQYIDGISLDANSLRNTGLSPDQIKKAVEQINIVEQNRALNVAPMPYNDMINMMDKMQQGPDPDVKQEQKSAQANDVKEPEPEPQPEPKAAEPVKDEPKKPEPELYMTRTRGMRQVRKFLLRTTALVTGLLVLQAVYKDLKHHPQTVNFNTFVNESAAIPAEGDGYAGDHYERGSSSHARAVDQTFSDMRGAERKLNGFFDVQDRTQDAEMAERKLQDTKKDLEAQQRKVTEQQNALKKQQQDMTAASQVNSNQPVQQSASHQSSPVEQAPRQKPFDPVNTAMNENKADIAAYQNDNDASRKTENELKQLHKQGLVSKDDLKDAKKSLRSERKDRQKKILKAVQENKQLMKIKKNQPDTDDLYSDVDHDVSQKQANSHRLRNQNTIR